MSDLVIEIDNQEIKAEEGMTILEAARKVGISIPTFCHHEKLLPYGACRLCIVEISDKGKSNLVASCVYMVKKGLKVKTESPRIIKIRKLLLELILAFWPWVDKDLLARYEVQPGRFEEELTFCLLCGLCVRYCTEIKKANALGFIGRGTERQVVLFPEIASKVCPGCEECISICPTGIIPNDFTLRVPHFEKFPVVFPVRLRDEDNLRRLLNKIDPL